MVRKISTRSQSFESLWKRKGSSDGWNKAEDRREAKQDRNAVREGERNEDKWLHRIRRGQIMKRANKRETKRWMDGERERDR